MPDYRPAASICLLHRASDSIMMGRRLVGPWPGYWAFPGGGLDDGETHFEAGLRELREETGIDLAVRTSLLTTIVHVSFGETRHYEIHNFVIDVEARLEGTTTVELEPRWIALPDTDALTPIAHGTQTVIDRVKAFLSGG